MQVTQNRYKKEYDKKDRQELQIRDSDEIYIDHAHHTTFAPDLA